MFNDIFYLSSTRSILVLAMILFIQDIGDNQIAIGVMGMIHKISSPGFLTIADLSSSSYDVVEASGIGLYGTSTYFFIGGWASYILLTLLQIRLLLHF